MQWLRELPNQLYRLWAYVTEGRTLAIVFGVLFAIVAVSLLIASRTKWGQSKSLTKAVALSILAHIWLLMYALGNRTILPQGDPNQRDRQMSVAFDPSWVTPNMESDQEVEVDDRPLSELPIWEQPVPFAELPKPELLQEMLLDSSKLSAPELLPALEPTPMPELETQVPETAATAAADLQPSVSEPVLPPPPVESEVRPPSRADTPSAAPSHQFTSSSVSPVLPPELQIAPREDMPRDYQLRQAPDRLKLAQAFGADADSEAAVEAGLQWLAKAQSNDGSWNAKHYGAGTETYALGDFRHGTGDRADTGISGLALLAFLSGGHTHLEGTYKDTVKQGLQYLLRAQMPSGDLSGAKQVGNSPNVVNARMYCHSIATLSLAEAYAMTHDAILREPLLRATQYSINAQDPRGGGWRYRPHDPGDLSQFGWVAMALRSVEKSGIDIPTDVKRRMQTFIDSCAAGAHGGLARYRPGEGRPSETMTAEALACRLLLDLPLSLDARREATEMIMSSLPGNREDNVYFWYYATLALFQLQDENWRTWNQVIKSRLLATQQKAYQDEAGSWNPDKLWGGYGGRVYSTAMSCLCLEVYYRYLPMYQRSNLARTPSEARSR